MLNVYTTKNTKALCPTLKNNLSQLQTENLIILQLT